ncbi:activator-dependent family glycosyltransferase [Amycolatopsis magusensis]|uniref:Glycosyltransferase (Activator-dependent family) n=1 Tax=Amycolatopsis magusensis TaxID=882444 RepID=A0ABS4PXU5_9PSEU|nr:activator-dependent family glycosyltransferase [Amycolatopsis magusensis]MBP2184251.1 glycosyltransferase (activator-dependent family) [Amycolatopsis magusensis]
MRVLFVTYPEKIMFLGMVPLAWALRNAGHEVRVASQPELTDVITTAGLTAVPVGRDHGLYRVLGIQPEKLAAARAGFPRPYDVVDVPKKRTWTYLNKGYEFAVTWWHKMENVPMITPLVAFARQWRPDLVLWEPTTFAGPIAAKATGAAHARISWGLDVFGMARHHFLDVMNRQPPAKRADPLANWLGGQAERFGSGFSEDMITGQFTVEQIPPSLRLETPGVRYVDLRYVPYGGPAAVPDWLREPPDRPRVLLTLGLSAVERFDGYTVDLAEILGSLAELDIEVVATIADRVRDRLGALPGNVRAVPFVPLPALLPTCSAVINHAGFGTLCTTALHSVPQLTLPVHFDEPRLAGALTGLGAGLTIPSCDATGELVRDHLVRLLAEPEFGEGAARLRDEMLGMPSPNEFAEELVDLVAEHRTAAAGG